MQDTEEDSDSGKTVADEGSFHLTREPKRGH